MTTKIAIALKASFTAGTPNAVRPTREWTRKAREIGVPKGRDAAKGFAGAHGYAVMIFDNGNTVLYVRDEESSDIIRIKFNGVGATNQPVTAAQDSAETQTTPPTEAPVLLRKLL